MPPTDDTTTPKKRAPRKAPAKKVTKSPLAPPEIEPEMAPPMPADKYAPTAWGQSPIGGMPEDFTVPSGQTCLVRRPGVEQLLVEGVLFESDMLTTMVHENVELVEKGRKPKDIDVEALMADPAKFADLMNTTDRIVASVVIKPNVQRALNDPTGRKPGVIYTDMIDLVDKFAIMEFALGGAQQLGSFRDEPEAGVGSARARKSTGGAAKRAPRRKR